MGICSWLVFGFIAGLLARAIVPGEQRMGWVATSLLGIGGSFVGGLLASFLTGHSLGHFHSSGLIGSVIGAVALLLLGSALGKRR